MSLSQLMEKLWLCIRCTVLWHSFPYFHYCLVPAFIFIALGVFLGFIRINVICPRKKRHKLNQIFTVQVIWNILSSFKSDGHFKERYPSFPNSFFFFQFSIAVKAMLIIFHPCVAIKSCANWVYFFKSSYFTLTKMTIHGVEWYRIFFLWADWVYQCGRLNTLAFSSVKSETP